MRKEWKERSALGIGEREAEGPEREEESNRTSLSSPSWIIFHSGPSFFPSCALPWRKQPKTRRKKRRSEVK